MAFRYVTPVEQYLLSDAVKVLAGGNLYFYDSGTSNPRATYADADLSVENTNPVILDASGRPNADIWMSGSYRVVLKDATGATVWTRDDVQGPADLPALAGNEGRALFTDGESLEWRDVSQVPSVTGQSGKILTNDGVDAFWQNPASSGIPALSAGKVLSNDGSNMAWVDLGPAESTSNSFRVGNMLVQMGSDTAPASGSTSTSKAVIFGTSFTSCLYAAAMPTSNSQPAQGPIVSYLSSPASGVSVTFAFDVAEGDKTSPSIGNAVPFTWIAIGLVS